jgi:hypothetical protein
MKLNIFCSHSLITSSITKFSAIHCLLEGSASYTTEDGQNESKQDAVALKSINEMPGTPAEYLLRALVHLTCKT